MDKHPVIQVINTFKPAYVVYNYPVDQLSTDNIGDLRKLQYQILKQGYSFTYGVLKLRILESPSSSYHFAPTKTLQDAIGDLDWKNTTCQATGSGLKSVVSHPVDGFQPVSRHCAGCVTPDFTKWDDSRTVADWNEPLPGNLANRPERSWPEHQTIHNVHSEMARALSFLDSWDFSGSLKDQYNQLSALVCSGRLSSSSGQCRKRSASPFSESNSRGD
ncbi:uncharacterized protein BT62DRAFT_999189 [Guyanagaster necrorhizus]|uniref:Uncharacterized protein n=1 Tax=Guyanagaster necrorhizus TaxID=856835 RepID=A0A9P8AZD0_9AGAR|nr:uncharacterized protein BT62DRAFT_999189 [Guyanagaster necrorhizus MCA 3950]KAG7453156.1 hypothetical protein BT62DRAFT_999189 [Guyanagaster necrorhizus MCA 3950]